MPVSVEIRRASPGFVTKEQGRHTRHAFSFGQHYDPENVGFGPLVCHDDHLLGGGRASTSTPTATSRSSPGSSPGRCATATPRDTPASSTPGVAQVLSAGSGVVHAETATDTGPARFVQVWLTPDQLGTSPTHATAEVKLPEGELVLVASGHDDAAPIRVGNASATFWVARLGQGDSVTLPDEPLQHVYVARGALVRSSMAQPLTEGDAFRIRRRPGLQLTAAVPTELLVWGFRD